MKTQINSFIILIISMGSILFFGCEDPMGDELSHRFSPTDEIISNPPHKNLPFVKQVIKRDFDGAKGWRIVWGGGEWDVSDVQKIPSIFSTVTGSVNSVLYLNNTSPQNTDNADMSIYFSLAATDQIGSLNYTTRTKKTLFKLSGMNVTDLQNAAENHPNLFTVAYEWDLNEPNGSLSMGNYQTGDIYSFKTDRAPAKYGAIRIVDKSPLTIEIVVQK
ncbi:hypothetical protein [Catalinimonas niigatensis]|uniref:hypothetical protein n=1 Tax=Catalinimonas niigatensis TaxID=1397264 RepID=UPI002666AA0E|nr:hypothetical protein [Catalinimonas niigatensis]WPP50754.1 hypothetical protein PZB72_29250 [Catalinimonas niigatensis]